MPKFRIIKRDAPDCFLWIMPNDERVWATEDEFSGFCENMPMGITIKRGDGAIYPIKGRELVEKSTRDFTADFAADYVSKFDEGKLVIAPGSKTAEEEKRSEKKMNILYAVGLLWIGAAIGSWLTSR